MRIRKSGLRRVRSPNSLLSLWAAGTLLFGGAAAAAPGRALELCSDAPLRLEKQSGPAIEQPGFRLFPDETRGAPSSIRSPRLPNR